MGWISDRHMKQGGSIGGNPKKCRETCRYPLRKIARVVRFQTSIFEPNGVEFECGHEGDCYGTQRGRCKKCPPRKPTP
jgi:hypothetical protein